MRQLLTLLLFLSPASAFALGAAWPISENPRFWILGEGLGHFSFDTEYFQSRENYDEQGIAGTPNSLGHTYYVNGRFHGAFGFAPRFSLFAQADYRGVIMSNTEAVSATAPRESNHGPGDAFLGARWLIWRSSPTDRVYPTEWSPETVLWLAESTWTFPMYDRAESGRPPLGEQSNDFSAISRLAWYTNEWLSFSGSAGYIYRTAAFDHLLPWNIRADFSLQERHRFRFWTELRSFERLKTNTLVLNSEQPDPFPNGSLLFKSYAPVIRTASLGVGYLLSKEWELVAAGNVTATGVNSAKGWGAGLGLAWRPYQVPEIKYEEYRQLQIERLQTERHDNHSREVVRYGFRATIVKVSARGNFVKIFYGEKDRVRQGDTFYILPPDNFSAAGRRPVALGTVAQVQPDAAYIHVDERYVDRLSIQEGFEVRRVYFDSSNE